MAGCVGYFSFNGNLDTCITIRTALCFPHFPHPACGYPVTRSLPLPRPLQGLRLRRIPFPASQAAQVPLPRARDNVQAGGGWVNDSEPEAEFQETVNKSKTMLKAVALAETIAKP